MKARGRVYHDIHTALSIWQRGELPSPETVKRRNRFEEELLKLQSLPNAELALANQRVEQTQQQLQRAETDRDYWRAQATTPRRSWRPSAASCTASRSRGAALRRDGRAQARARRVGDR